MEGVTTLPRGTVTFLFTDIEGSTRLWDEHPEAMRLALARHDALAAALIAQHEGLLVKSRGEGDSLFAVFSRAPEAVAAAAAIQHALLAEPWPPETPLRIRIALHTDAAERREGDYYGPGVNRCARLRAVAHGGQVLLSRTTRDLVEGLLPEGASLLDLGSHRLKDLRQPEHLFQWVAPGLPDDFPPLRSLEAFAHNLPAQLTSFIGREQAMGEVKQFLATTRLLTLTGSGGCGKTRLALQVAADLLEEYGDGVWLVELAPLADPALVPQTVAATLGVREEPGRPLIATLTDYLRPKQVLLVLDNCEHVLAACAQLAESLLRSCPSLRMLTSSREGLGIAGERTYRVPSLSLPQPPELPPVERFTEYEAVRLFVERAVFTQPGFVVTEQNASAVVQVCQRLDGIPLALELAAARVRALPVEKLNERLDEMFRLLTGGSRTALPRQQTLRALIDWSYDLLSKPERVLFRRLSVFAGGWTLEAAEAVCVGEGVEEWEILDLLTSLAEKSLVLYEGAPPAGWTGSEGRYRLLQTVRQYARDRLLETGEAAVRHRHLDWFLALSEEAEPQIWTHLSWLRRLDSEHDNVRAAMDWCAGGSPETGLRLAGALHWFWYIRGHYTEARRRLEVALAGSPRAEASVRWKALCGAAQIVADLGDKEQARAWGEESLALCREAGDSAGMAWSLLALAGGLLNPGGREWTPEPEQALSLFREMEDTPGTALALYMSGMALATKDEQRAISLYEESLALSRSAGYRWFSSYPLEVLGWNAYLSERQLERARALFEESLAIRREYGDRVAMMHTLHGLSGVTLNLGDGARATTLVEESLVLCRESGNKLIVLAVLEGAGCHFFARGEYDRARAHFEEFLALSKEMGKEVVGALRELALVAQVYGDREKATALFEQGLATSREQGDKYSIAQSLGGLGRVARDQGEQEAAWALLEESLALCRELGLKSCIVQTLNSLGQVACDRGEYEAARALFEESLGICRKLELSPAIAWSLDWMEDPGTPSSLGGLGSVAHAQGEYEAARALLEESLAIWQGLGFKPRIVKDLEGLAAVAVAQVQSERAGRLFGAADGLREAMGAPLPPAERAEHDRSVAAVRAALGEEAFAVAWAEGRAMTLEEAVKYALEE